MTQEHGADRCRCNPIESNGGSATWCERCEKPKGFAALSSGASIRDDKIVCVELVLPVNAIQLLYDVLGHFPHAGGSWSNVARGNCSVALWDAKDPEKWLYA